MAKKIVSRETENLVDEILEACRQVHHKMGLDCLEADYQRALAVEFEKRGLDYRTEVPVVVTYDEEVLTTRRADFEVRWKEKATLFLEVKAKDRVTQQDERQTRLYASLGEYPICILVNFGESPLYAKSFVGTQYPPRRATQSYMRQVFYATHNADAWRRNPPEKWPERGFNRRISSAHEPRQGDVLLIYKFPASTDGAGICEIYSLAKVGYAYVTRWLDLFGRPEPTRPPAFGYFVTDVKLVARLKKPITYQQMGTKPAIRSWNRWRARFRGLSNGCGLIPAIVWQALRELVIAENPDVADTLERLGV